MRKLGKAITVIILSTLLGIPLTILSLWYQNPPGCNRFCSREPCPSSACIGGDSLTAGFPFAILHDDNAGSPVHGWGRIGVEDIQNLNLGAFLLNAFFYGVIIVMLFAITKSIFKSVKRSIGLG
ncbi:hypothetical protein [Nostoc sp. C057]|jgi:hypothetical protein|uniref:hypothetical protein n=1 Tax=unclassified Nostoc TaxID=2593658 RepID=UPI0015C318E2|nr:hypothetical protein [Nostoc sp. C057]MBD2509561.1 hypothetical protein [Desmonostoc muscorum FACHB-395]QLE48677.1 hypothetical protein FD724_11480 [Nostoc sp. C057]